MEQLNLQGAIIKGIIPNYEDFPRGDTLGQVSKLLEVVRTKFQVEILIQSNIDLDRDKPTVWQCLIGRRLNDYADAQTFANGTGESIGAAIIRGLNEFIEYYGLNKRDLLK